MPGANERQMPLFHDTDWSRLLGGVGLVLGAAVAGCGGSDPLTQPRARLTPEHVTPAVAAHLTADGHFVMPAAAANPVGQVNQTEANAIALRYVKDVAKLKLPDWVAAHGGPIDAGALATCDRPLYAATPYAPIAGGAVSEVTVRTFGPHWVVPLCGHANDLEVVVSFSALATELAENVSNGAMPWERGNVLSFGVPQGANAAMYSPEGAALYAFNASGKRVNSVPALVMTPMPKVPALVRWRLDLEAPVNVVGAHSGVARDLLTVLVGFGDTFHSSGMLDRDPQGESPPAHWTDPVTKTQFTVVELPTAPGPVESITRRNP